MALRSFRLLLPRFCVVNPTTTTTTTRCLCSLPTGWDASRPFPSHSFGSRTILSHQLKNAVLLTKVTFRPLCNRGDSSPPTLKSEADKIFTIPNILTFGRLLSAPAITYCVLNGNFSFAFGLFFVAGLSDIVDGYIARNWKGQNSVMGSVLDPLADKVLVTCLSLSLCYVDLLPVWLVSLIIFRDICLMTGAFYLRYVSLPSPKTISRYFDVTLPTIQMKPLAISKFNTGVQLLLITSMLSSPVFGFAHHPYLDYLCYFTGLTTLLSGVSYIFSRDTFTIIGKRVLKK